MTILKNILIIAFATVLSAFFVYGSFAFGTISAGNIPNSGIHQIKKTTVNIKTDSK